MIGLVLHKKLGYKVANLTQLAINYILKDCHEAKPQEDSIRVKESKTFIVCSPIIWLEKALNF